MAASKTDREMRITRFVMLPLYIVILPGLSVGSVFYLSSQLHLDLSFVDILVHLYGIWLIVHLWDLLVIDASYMLLINFQRPPIKGTEGAKGWKDYSFHIRSFLTAATMSGLFVVPVSGLLAVWL